MKRTRYLMLLICLLGAVATYAGQTFKPKLDISDGKDGRPYAKWSQAVAEKPIVKVDVVIQRISGGDDTFINLRFGDRGQTLEGGRRVYLTDAEAKKVTFQLGGAQAGGKPLVVNAYNGVVKLRRVEVGYRK